MQDKPSLDVAGRFLVEHGVMAEFDGFWQDVCTHCVYGKNNPPFHSAAECPLADADCIVAHVTFEPRNPLLGLAWTLFKAQNHG